MIYLIIILISLIAIYLILLFSSKNKNNIITGSVEEITKNYILIKSYDQKYFVQVTDETNFNGISWSDIKVDQTISIEYMDLITTSKYHQTFGKSIFFFNKST